MTPDRNVEVSLGAGAGVRVLGDERPLTARSVVASVLLGLRPPELSGQRLVRTAELFGSSEGTTRVALSRMVAAGELTTSEGRYRLAGALLARQVRQDASRVPNLRPWSGDWQMAVVAAGGARPAGERGELRRTLSALHLAEWREGVWIRPDNLGEAGAKPPRVVSCTWMIARPLVERTNASLAMSLWDLTGWAARSDALRERMRHSIGDLRAGATEALAPCFITAAAVVRHIQADPLLPEDLLPQGWSGGALRADYDSYEAAYRGLLREWLRGLPR